MIISHCSYRRDLCTYSISNNADGIACSQTREAYRQTSAHVHEPREQRVLLLRRRLDVAGNKDGNDEGVNGQDTRHDNGDQRLHRVSQSLYNQVHSSCLHDQVRSVCSNTGNTNTSFGCAIRSSHACFRLASTRLYCGVCVPRTSK